MASFVLCRQVGGYSGVPGTQTENTTQQVHTMHSTLYTRFTVINANIDILIKQVSPIKSPQLLFNKVVHTLNCFALLKICTALRYS